MGRHSKEIARDVAVITTTVSNCYLVGTEQSWVLVDALGPGNEDRIVQAAEERFGTGACPDAIVLTHGHFDHVGSAPQLVERWDVRIHAHRLEFPYLTGLSAYPALDPTTPGFFSALSRFFPSQTAYLGNKLLPVDPENPLADLYGWECYETPGHSPGHLSFYRGSDGVLLAGDAVTTVDLDSAWATLTRKQEVSKPPAPATTDWVQARRSVEQLAKLRPAVIAAGHGTPVQNGAAEQLAHLAVHFDPPAHGRYVPQPARADETGVIYLPPAPFDPGPIRAASVVAATALVIAGVQVIRRSHGERSITRT